MDVQVVVKQMSRKQVDGKTVGVEQQMLRDEMRGCVMGTKHFG